MTDVLLTTGHLKGLEDDCRVIRNLVSLSVCNKATHLALLSSSNLGYDYSLGYH